MPRNFFIVRWSSLSYGHMDGMRLRTHFAAENRVVTWRCGDCTVSKETYCVAYNLTWVWRIRFQPQRPLRQYLTAGLWQLFLPDSPHALHRSALHVTTLVETLPIKNVTSHTDSRQTAHVTAPSSSLNKSIWSKNGQVQYIPRNMHTVFALLCFVVVIHWLIFPYPSGLLHCHCGNLTIAPVLAKQPWWIWINTSCEFIMNYCITTTKQSTTKPCAYFLGYTVIRRPFVWCHNSIMH